jgi:hypothetical protein
MSAGKVVDRAAASAAEACAVCQEGTVGHRHLTITTDTASSNGIVGEKGSVKDHQFSGISDGATGKGHNAVVREGAVDDRQLTIVKDTAAAIRRAVGRESTVDHIKRSRVYDSASAAEGAVVGECAVGYGRRPVAKNAASIRGAIRREYAVIQFNVPLL